LFGHEVKLNFLREGETHNTVCGGYFTLAMKIILLIYFLACFSRCVDRPAGHTITSDEILMSRHGLDGEQFEFRD